MVPTDCMQVLHRRYRDTEVRPLITSEPSPTYVSR